MKKPQLTAEQKMFISKLMARVMYRIAREKNGVKTVCHAKR